MRVKLGYGVVDDIEVIQAAQAHGIEVNPHVGGSAVAQAASLQVIAALPVTHQPSSPPTRCSSTTVSPTPCAETWSPSPSR